MQKIGDGLTSFGVFFMMLVVMLFFDGALLNQTLFARRSSSSAASSSISAHKRHLLFRRKNKLRSTVCFLGGILLVFLKWPTIGVLVKIFSFLNLSGDFFLVMLTFLRQLPFLGQLLNLPYIRSVHYPPSLSPLVISRSRPLAQWPHASVHGSFSRLTYLRSMKDTTPIFYYLALSDSTAATVIVNPVSLDTAYWRRPHAFKTIKAQKERCVDETQQRRAKEAPAGESKNLPQVVAAGLTRDGSITSSAATTRHRYLSRRLRRGKRPSLAILHTRQLLRRRRLSTLRGHFYTNPLVTQTIMPSASLANPIARCIKVVPNWQRHRADAHDQLVQSLTRLVTTHPPGSLRPSGGLYYGPLSIAYLLLRLNEWYPDVQLRNRTLRSWASEYRQRAIVDLLQRRGPTIDKCGIIDQGMTKLALEAAFDRNVNAATRFVEWANTVAESERAGNEWLYGRAGVLYFLRLIRRTWVETPSISQTLDITASKLIRSIMDAERPWTWHGKNYLGAVHGTIGIITQIVLTRPSIASELEGELQAVLDEQFSDSGNFPSSLPAGRDRLVQFCHGAPGVITSLMSLRHYFPNLRERIDSAILRGQACILARGILTKESCLCHGTSGNALALEGDALECLMNHTTAAMMARMEEEGLWEQSDNPEGLYTGEAGRAWAWAVVDREVGKRFLGYNDL
ncbi:hypothetical protein BC827DRAFT_1383826 [Russula dissimulans]|nr:hypothetical protein BC827DRAFT_1383826 [Russula dissimulans]